MAPKRQRKNEQPVAAGSKKARPSSSGEDSDKESNDTSPTENGQEKNNDAGDQRIEQFPKLDNAAGRLLVCGGTNWDLIGRKELPKKNPPNTSTGKNNLIQIVSFNSKFLFNRP